MSKTLYIIGNGFDRAHSMPVCYSCFKHYLEKDNGKKNECVNCIYRTEESCNRSECYLLSLLNTAIGDKENWSDFEEALARLDFTVLGDVRTYMTFDNLIDNFGEQIQEAFHSWINKIVIPPKECHVFDLDLSAHYLTFNYTMTLEQMYDIAPSNIYHIHCSTKGQQSKGEKYVFGHSSDIGQIKKSMRGTVGMNGLGDSVLDEWSIAIERIKKDTFTIKRELQDKLKNAKLGNPQIKIIGHSFGRADYDYFEVLRNLFPNAQWIYYYHSTDALCEAQNNVNLFMREKGIINVTYEPISNIRI